MIFIVAMTLAVLASLGLYALNSASFELKTAGYERQYAQSQYLAEYALTATAQRLDTGAALVYYAQMMDPTGATSQYDPTKPRNGCYALANVTSGSPQAAKACRRIQRVEFQDAYGAVPALPVPAFGNTLLDGDFDVELTDPVRGALNAGNGVGTMCDLKFTATAMGRTLGQGATSYIKYGSEGLSLGRAQILVPNVFPCPAN